MKVSSPVRQPGAPTHGVIADDGVEAARVSASRYRRLFETAQDGILLLNAETAQIDDVNPYLIAMLGYTHEEFLGKKLWEVGAFADRPESKQMFDVLKTVGYVRYEDLPLMTKSGVAIEVEFVSNTYDCGGIKVAQCNIRNITDRKLVEAKLRRQTQLYAALCACNEAIMRSHVEVDLLEQVCRAAVEFGGMKIAWAGFVEPASGEIRAVASSGDELGYVDALSISVDADSERGRGPTGIAFRENRAYWCQDIRTDSSTAVWRAGAARSCIVSTASLPLHREGVPVGTFSLYHGEPGAFDELARDLVTRMAADISFALDNLAHEARRKRNQEEIALKNTILKTQLETSLDGILVVDADGRILSFNQRFSELWGVAPALVHDRMDSVVLDCVKAQVEGPDSFAARVRYLYEHREEASSEEIALLDGRTFDRYSAPVTGEDGKYYGRVWYFRDITSRKGAERRIAYLNRVYAMLSSINALIVAATDARQLFRGACQMAVEKGGFRVALVATLDRGAKKLVPVGSAGADEALIAEIKRILASSRHAAGTMVWQAIASKVPVVCNDSRRDQRVVHGARYAELGVRSMVVLPLMAANKTLGVLALYAGEREFFHAEEMRLLVEFAGDISYALENLERQQRLVILSRVRRVSSEISAAMLRIHERDELFQEVCRIAVGSGGFPLAWVAEVDNAAMRLRPVARAGLAADGPDQLPLSLDEADTENFGLAGRAVLERRTMVADDLAHDPRVRLHAGARAHGLHSLVALPLRISPYVVSVLVLYAREIGAFDRAELELLSELEGNISFAIDHIEKSKKLNYLAYYDELTGLANRGLFLERLGQYIRSAAAGGHGLGLFLVDVERFKNINDSLGRSSGDELLRQVAAWLTHTTADAGVVGRTGGDHFAVVLPVVKPDGNPEHLLEKGLSRFFAHPFQLNEAVLRVSARVGAALFPGDGNDAEALYANAEAALKSAKASGERYLFHTQKMTEYVTGRLTLENQLRNAIENEEFVLHYQPKVDLKSCRLTGAEALIRWNDPRTGLVPPGLFIPVLEESGMIHEVGHWAIRQALGDYLAWCRAGLPAVRIAVNVSSLQLRNRGFIADVGHVLSADARAPAGLELEITESVIMSDIKGNTATLQAIRALGVKIAIDDFGTGFSSLSYLARLPVDTLKIDRSFVVEVTVSPEGLALASTIINLAHSLKLTVVAEGVETEEQSRLLRLLSCDEMQGFLYSKAVPCDTFEALFLRPAAVA
jgi:diguanylate cyclase (GGDEF)-like protein/PAS domain S-box-containing protein